MERGEMGPVSLPYCPKSPLGDCCVPWVPPCPLSPGSPVVPVKRTERTGKDNVTLEEGCCCLPVPAQTPCWLCSGHRAGRDPTTQIPSTTGRKQGHLCLFYPGEWAGRELQPHSPQPHPAAEKPISSHLPRAPSPRDKEQPLCVSPPQ